LFVRPPLYRGPQTACNCVSAGRGCKSQTLVPFLNPID
jgi:hypothetical protein